MKYKWFLFSLVVFTLLIIKPIIPSNGRISNMLAIVIFMALLWLTETLPIGVTALFPLILYPIFQISNANQVAINYFNSTIFLFLGGFMISIAIENTGLHKRIALALLKILGQSKDGILMAFSISSWFLSMFVSNTATALIMLPIAVSLINNVSSNIDLKSQDKFAKSILFAIAYSCSIGGIATLIGTPPNLIFQKIYTLNFPELPEVSFAKWLSIAFPISVLLLFSEYFLLRIIFLKNLPSRIINKEKLIENNFYKHKITTPEVITLVVFIATCGLWMFRNSFDLGLVKIPGWADLLGLSNLIDDSTISIFSAVLLFILPSNFKNLSKRILTINDLKKIPWDIILLFGGGFALADGFESTGLSDYLAQSLVGLTHIPQIALIIVVCILIVAITEFSSNTAVASTFLPIIASLTKTLGISPIKLMLPATISASLAFMLPISTPPNAIVFSTGKIKIQEMAMVGISLNIIGIVVVSFYFYMFF